jgi:hypothetical protein
MGWQTQYRLIGIEPGRVKTSRFGMVDFADPNLPIETVRDLYEAGLPYLERLPDVAGEEMGIETRPTTARKGTGKIKK